MESLLSGLAFACLVCSWVLAIIAVHKEQWEDPFCAYCESSKRAFVRNIWLFGSA
jgi:hypothetical protein